MHDGIKHAKGFVHVTTEAEIVDSLTLHNTIGIDDESATERKSRFLVKEVVCLSHLAALVAKQGVTKRADAAVSDLGVAPVDV